jgi:arsenate reductase-like glutaredoxin family protein
MPAVSNPQKITIKEGALKIKDWIAEERERVIKSRTADKATHHIEEMIENLQRQMKLILRPVVSSRTQDKGGLSASP